MTQLRWGAAAVFSPRSQEKPQYPDTVLSVNGLQQNCNNDSAILGHRRLTPPIYPARWDLIGRLFFIGSGGYSSISGNWMLDSSHQLPANFSNNVKDLNRDTRFTGSSQMSIVPLSIWIVTMEGHLQIWQVHFSSEGQKWPGGWRGQCVITQDKHRMSHG
ncbi:hypothetical protein INR49_031361 [Caranx melampygus]|nr:hypothetical protein INR49_031361 [Caranx melampygus]